MADKWTDQGWPVLTMTTQVENSIPRMQHSKFLLSETRVTDQCLEQQTNHSFIHFKHNYKLPTVAATICFSVSFIAMYANCTILQELLFNNQFQCFVPTEVFPIRSGHSLVSCLFDNLAHQIFQCRSFVFVSFSRLLQIYYNGLAAFLPY